MINRRDFLSRTSKTIALGSLIPGYSFSAINRQSALGSLLAPVATMNDHVLVIIQLAGGNDGLNTLIPLDQYSNLTTHRSNIIINSSKVLALNGTTKTGLHPSMSALRTMYNDGKVNFVQSVGYAEQNYSHFRSTDIWLSGSDSNTVVNTGWMGRYLDYEFSNFPDNYPNTDMPDPLAIQIGAVISPGFQGPKVPMAVSITSDKDFYDIVNGTHSNIDKSTPIGKELAYVREVAGQAKAYNAVIKTAAGKVTTQATYPTGNALADQLKIVSKLIKGGLKTKIYMVSLGGFDTHAGQTDTDTTTGSHANLLGQLSEAISAFQNDLKFQGIEDKVIGMTFSEFGRRIVSNGSLGTDHGSSLPMIFFGTKVQNGIIGTNPTIDANFTTNDNLIHQYDFRSVYASILEQWFCVDKVSLNTLLFKNYQTLPIIKSTACTTTGINSYQKEIEENRLSCWPNPFNNEEKVNIQINSKGGHNLIEIFNTEGKLVDTIVDNSEIPGVYTYTWQNETLPSGFYYCRFQNEGYQSVFTLQKVR